VELASRHLPPPYTAIEIVASWGAEPASSGRRHRDDAIQGRRTGRPFLLRLVDLTSRATDRRPAGHDVGTSDRASFKRCPRAALQTSGQWMKICSNAWVRADIA
jgi:hypothetical protein